MTCENRSVMTTFSSSEMILFDVGRALASGVVRPHHGKEIGDSWLPRVRRPVHGRSLDPGTNQSISSGANKSFMPSRSCVPMHFRSSLATVLGATVSRFSTGSTSSRSSRKAWRYASAPQSSRKCRSRFHPSRAELLSGLPSGNTRRSEIVQVPRACCASRSSISGA